jgi:hypothetical protein
MRESYKNYIIFIVVIFTWGVVLIDHRIRCRGCSWDGHRGRDLRENADDLDRIGRDFATSTARCDNVNLNGSDEYGTYVKPYITLDSRSPRLFHSSDTLPTSWTQDY